MLFDNIPQELKDCPQWVCWRLEFEPPMAKPTKPLYVAEAGRGKASVTDKTTWRTFAQAVAAPLTCLEPCLPAAPISETGYSGIGFVFSHDDEYVGIDLDDTHGDVDAYNRQQRIFQEFNSYTEMSPSGTGVHIIVKGKLPSGRRRANIELYPHARFFTMTGDVINNVPIVERQELLNLLYQQMGGDVLEYQVKEEAEEIMSDEDIMATATAAQNGDKFLQLWQGDWHNDYASQSEADIALYNMIAFYSKHRLQSRRIFRQSILGQRDKAQRDAYLDYMFVKSFDNQLPAIDTEGLRIKLDEMFAKDAAASLVSEPGKLQTNAKAAAPLTHNASAATLPSDGPNVNAQIFPPGLIGQIAAYFYAIAPRPVPEIALAGAIAYMAGIAGRGYNVSGTGLNQYILLLAPTGVGKDAIADGVSKLNKAVQIQVPSIIDFKGPGELVSSAGLIKWLDRKPCVLSILGEFGKKMKEMSAPNANAHLTGLSRVLLQMYSKSGHNSEFDAMAYSDKEKNTAPIMAPSLTILGESVPESFYESLDESMIADGLLPRFMLFEYKGKRSYLNRTGRDVLPPFALVQSIADLAANCLQLSASRNVINVTFTPEAEEKFKQFDTYTTDIINETGGELYRQLWNRADLKAMKLAALQAVGENPLNPVIGIEQCLWATALVVDQINKLLAKYETGTVGQVGGSEGKQISEVIRVVAGYMSSEHERYAKYGGTFEMHKSGVVTESHIQRRLVATTCFKQDRLGPTAAIKRALKTLIEADELREMPKLQMQQQFGTGPRAYVVANPARFVVKD